MCDLFLGGAGEMDGFWIWHDLTAVSLVLIHQTGPAIKEQEREVLYATHISRSPLLSHPAA